jgi:hypothetical protein
MAPKNSPWDRFGTDGQGASSHREITPFAKIERTYCQIAASTPRFTRRRTKIGLHQAVSRCNLALNRAFLGVHLGSVG